MLRPGFGPLSVRQRTNQRLVPRFSLKGKDYRFLPRIEDEKITSLVIINDSDGVSYDITPGAGPEQLLVCSCPDFQARGAQRPCKHMRALLAIEKLIRELILSPSSKKSIDKGDAVA